MSRDQTLKGIVQDLVEEFKKYSPDQDRDENGRWTDGGGTGGKNQELPSRDLPGITVNGVREAIRERPSRMTHGNTGKNAFVLTPDGEVHAWDKAPWGSLSGGITVHSHSVENWQQWEKDAGKPEDFQPLNAADIDLFRKQFAEGRVAATAIIMADGRMEIVAPSSNQTLDQKSAWFKVKGKRLDTMLHGDREERTAFYESHRASSTEHGWAAGYNEYSLDRIKLREYCRKFGLDYHENLRWR